MLKIDINLVFEIVNLLILFVAMRIFLFKPVRKIIEERQAEADRQFEEAENSKKAADELKDKYEQTLSNAEIEKKQVISEARKNAEKEYQRIINDANEKAREVKENAVIDAENQKKQILKKAEKEIADIAIEAAGKISASKGDYENDMALYDKFINKVGEK